MFGRHGYQGGVRDNIGNSIIKNIVLLSGDDNSILKYILNWKANIVNTESGAR